MLDCLGRSVCWTGIHLYRNTVPGPLVLSTYNLNITECLILCCISTLSTCMKHSNTIGTCILEHFAKAFLNLHNLYINWPSSPTYFFFKGTVSQDFLHQVFFRFIFSKAPDNNIRVISNLFENLWRYLQVKVHHWFQHHRRQICPRCQVNLPLMLMSPVSRTPHRWEIMGKFIFMLTLLPKGVLTKYFKLF